MLLQEALEKGQSADMVLMKPEWTLLRTALSDAPGADPEVVDLVRQLLDSPSRGAPPPPITMPAPFRTSLPAPVIQPAGVAHAQHPDSAGVRPSTSPLQPAVTLDSSHLGGPGDAGGAPLAASAPATALPASLAPHAATTGSGGQDSPRQSPAAAEMPPGMALMLHQLAAMQGQLIQMHQTLTLVHAEQQALRAEHEALLGGQQSLQISASLNSVGLSQLLQSQGHNRKLLVCSHSNTIHAD